VRPVAIAFGLLLVLAGAWLMYETRGTTLWFDEWLWALEHGDNSLGGFIAPHNGHPTLIPVAIYRFLFATVGIDTSAPYRAVGIAGHLLVVAVLYLYAVRRAGVGVALCAAVLLLFLGPGWQNIVWPLQIGWLVSLAAGLGALIALERRDRFGDVAAAVLVLACVAASGPGVAIAAGIGVEVLRDRGRRAIWVVAVPLAVFAIWWLAYQDSGTVRREIALVPGFVADSAAATLSALAGLAGPLIRAEGATLGWGRPLAVAAAALLLWRLWRLERVPSRVVGLLAILGAFWVLTAVQRAGVGPAESSRYVYVGAVFVLALAVELVGGVAVSRRAWLVVGAAVAAITVANIGDMRTGAQFLREQALITRTGLTALEIALPVADPDAPVTGIAGYPLVVVRARDYFALKRDLGTPAIAVEELPRQPEGARLRADEELIGFHGLTLEPAETDAEGTPPTVDAETGGEATTRDECVDFQPDAAGPLEPPPAVDLTVPSTGLLLRAPGNGGATVTLRRFADSFQDEPVGRVMPGGDGLLAIRTDLSPVPWHARVEPEARITVCGAPF
jgi:hypothetical protein